MNKNLIQRSITGILFVAVLVGCILYNPFSFGILFVIISGLSVYEFGQLVNKHMPDAAVNKLITMLGGAYLFLAFMSYSIGTSKVEIFIPYLFLLLYLFISELYLKKENPILNWSLSVMSQLYIALPFALLNTLAFAKDVDETISFNPILPLSIFIFLWLSDTGAYCVGSLIGKHRLFERISPKKSWEGSIGGGILALLGGSLLNAFFPFLLNMWEWLGLALVVVVFGTWGDLTESLLKRKLGVKDSGNILPGHGGLLDRFDSALMAIPASVCYLFLLNLLD